MAGPPRDLRDERDQSRLVAGKQQDAGRLEFLFPRPNRHQDDDGPSHANERDRQVRGVGEESFRHGNRQQRDRRDNRQAKKGRGQKEHAAKARPAIGGDKDFINDLREEKKTPWPPKTRHSN